jgi:hypothetical protein
MTAATSSGETAWRTTSSGETAWRISRSGRVAPHLLSRDGLGGPEDRDPGRVDDHVRPAPGGVGVDPAGRRGDRAGVGDVQRQGPEAGILAGQGVQRLLTTRGRVDLVAAARQPGRGGPADAATGPGDQDDRHHTPEDAPAFRAGRNRVPRAAGQEQGGRPYGAAPVVSITRAIMSV